MSKRLAVSLLILVFLGNSCNRAPMMTINGHKIEIEIAQTAEERSKGLSGKQSMSDDRGMLFVFETAGIYGFWMKDMHFPLDFIWIKDGIVVEISKNVPVENDSDLTIYKPNQPIDSVLEVNAGWADKNEIKIGDKTKID
jgi:uncharacterized membrane protein (UPF0127 family)